MPSFHAAASASSADFHRSTATTARSRGFIAENNSAPLMLRLAVFMTPGGKGWGLRTLEDLPKGAFVCEYVGKILTNAELFVRVSKCPSSEEHAYPVLLDADWGSEGVLKNEEALCLDATHYGNVVRFINHSVLQIQEVIRGTKDALSLAQVLGLLF
ncbi:unnamed protein product [Camellia sinensis]